MDQDQIQRLLTILARLRGPDGCAWDQNQDLASAARFLSDEVFEYVDAASSGDPERAAEELSDLFYMVAFNWLILAETSDLRFQDLAARGADKLIHRKPISDSRGYLERLFCTEELHSLVPGKRIEQINHTLTVQRGAVRGLHFQYPPHAECKFVSCLCGKVFDVAVDLRKGSATFLKWHAEILSADNHKTLLIRVGFAHGFQTLADNTKLLYFHTAAHQPGAEGALNVFDRKLNINWPETLTELSPRDAAHPYLTESFVGVVV